MDRLLEVHANGLQDSTRRANPMRMSFRECSTVLMHKTLQSKTLAEIAQQQQQEQEPQAEQEQQQKWQQQQQPRSPRSNKGSTSSSTSPGRGSSSPASPGAKNTNAAIILNQTHTTTPANIALEDDDDAWDRNLVGDEAQHVSQRHLPTGNQLDTSPLLIPTEEDDSDTALSGNASSSQAPISEALSAYDDADDGDWSEGLCDEDSDYSSTNDAGQPSKLCRKPSAFYGMHSLATSPTTPTRKQWNDDDDDFDLGLDDDDNDEVEGEVEVRENNDNSDKNKDKSSDGDNNIERRQEAKDQQQQEEEEAHPENKAELAKQHRSVPCSPRYCDKQLNITPDMRRAFKGLDPTAVNCISNGSKTIVAMPVCSV